MHQKICSTKLQEDGSYSLKWYMGHKESNVDVVFNKREELEFEQRKQFKNRIIKRS